MPGRFTERTLVIFLEMVRYFVMQGNSGTANEVLKWMVAEIKEASHA